MASSQVIEGSVGFLLKELSTYGQIGRSYTSRAFRGDQVVDAGELGLGRIVGMLTLEAEDINATLNALREAGSSIAMHIVAAKPLFLSKDLVSSEAMESERDILKSQVENSGQPQMAIQKMVEGRLRKYFEEVVLLEQNFVKNDGVNIQSLLNELSKQVGSSIETGNFLLMEVREGFQRQISWVQGFKVGCRDSKPKWLIQQGMGNRTETLGRMEEGTR